MGASPRLGVSRARSVCWQAGRSPVVASCRCSFFSSFFSRRFVEAEGAGRTQSSQHSPTGPATGFPSAWLLAPSPLPPLPSRQPTCCDLWEGLAQGSQTGKFPVYTRIPWKMSLVNLFLSLTSLNCEIIFLSAPRVPTLHGSHMTSCILACAPSHLGRTWDGWQLVEGSLSLLACLLRLGDCGRWGIPLSPTLLITRIEAGTKSMRPLGFVFSHCTYRGHVPA